MHDCSLVLAIAHLWTGAMDTCCPQGQLHFAEVCCSLKERPHTSRRLFLVPELSADWYREPVQPARLCQAAEVLMVFVGN